MEIRTERAVKLGEPDLLRRFSMTKEGGRKETRIRLYWKLASIWPLTWLRMMLRTTIPAVSSRNIRLKSMMSGIAVFFFILKRIKTDPFQRT